MSNRPRGMSQLDYLWVTYGGYSISKEAQEDPSVFIPTQELVLDLIKQTSNKTVGSISLKGNKLILYSTDGFEIDQVDITELTSNNVKLVDFGSKLISQQDIDKGCQFELNTKVYYIKLDNGQQFYAKQESLSGSETSSIKTEIIDGKIVSTLKIDSNQGNVLLSTDKGLKATLPFKNLGVPVQFTYITQDEYNQLSEHKLGTLYFIKDKPYYYLNGVKVGGESTVEIVDQLPVLGENGKLYILKTGNQYRIYTYSNGVAIAVGSEGELALDKVNQRVLDIEQTLTWKEY